MSPFRNAFSKVFDALLPLQLSLKPLLLRAAVSLPLTISYQNAFRAYIKSEDTEICEYALLRTAISHFVKLIPSISMYFEIYFFVRLISKTRTCYKFSYNYTIAFILVKRYMLQLYHLLSFIS